MELPSAGPGIEVVRSVLAERDFMFLEGSYERLFEGHLAWLGRHRLPVPPQEVLPTLRVGIQAITLWTSFLPLRTSTAWSILMPGREWRLFFAADSGTGTCVARWSPYEDWHQQLPATFDSQISRPRSPIQRSVFEPEGSALLAIVNEFFDRAEQTAGQLHCPGNSDEAQMLVALADKDLEWFAALQDLPRDQRIPTEKLGPMNAFGPPQRWIFRCGCDSRRLREATLAAAGGDVAAVFGNDPTVEIECPRCGRQHLLRRP